MPTVALKTLGKQSREGSASDEGSRDDPSLGEIPVSGPVGSSDDLDLLEDLLRSRKSRVTGFVGKNSEVQWLQGIDLSGMLAEEEASIDRGHSFQSHPTSNNMAFSSHLEKSFPQRELGMPSFNLNFGSQFSINLGEQQPAPAFEEFRPDQAVMLDPSVQIPSTFGNRFITTLDQPNLLNKPLCISRDG